MKFDFVVFDTEDDSPEVLAAGRDGREKQVTQIAAINNRTGKRFYNNGNAEEFKTWLCSQGEEVVCYAHNVMYDLGNIFRGQLDAYRVRMVGGRMISATWRNVTFLDSFNIWPMGAKKIGEAFGLKKMTMDVHSKEYVFRDVEIIRRAMQFANEFAEENGVDGLPSTLGGLCVRVWKAMGGQNFCCTDDFARQAYYGGRVELFNQGGEGNILYTDINSLYPFCMTMPFPDDWYELDGLDGYGVADVTLRVPKSFITTLPVRREDGSIYFPHGELRPRATAEKQKAGELYGAWTLHEIRDAMQHGAKLVKIHRVMGSVSANYPYRNFVEKFYEMRRTEKNEAKKLMLKLVMNNLYGRLGNSGVVTESINLKDEDFTTGGHYIGEGTPYGKRKLIDLQKPLDEHTNFLHAAYVTGYARLELAKYLRQLGHGKLIYCDTDSVIFYSPDNQIPFPITDRLGGMKLEGKAKVCRVHLPKVYQFGENYKAKGVRKNLAKEYIEKGRVEYELPYRFRESVSMFDPQHDENGNVIREADFKPLSVWRKVDKEKVGEYDRKDLSKDGNYWPKLFSEKEEKPLTKRTK